MQPMAQCNTPHRSLQCNTLRYTTVRFDPLCVNATLISQIHTCGAILLPQWQHKCNQIWCIVSFQKVERTRYKHLIAQIRIFLWSTVHFKMTEIYRSNPPMWRIKEKRALFGANRLPQDWLGQFHPMQEVHFLALTNWPIAMQVVKVESRGSILSPIRLLSACQSTSSLCQLGRKKGTIIRLNNIGNNNNNNNNKNSNNNKKWPPLRKKTQLFYLFIVNTN